jgi:hypothetical protein
MADIESDLRGLRVVGVGLIGGPALFLLLSIYLRSDPEGAFQARPEQPVVTWASLFAAVTVVAISLLLPRPKGGDIGRIRGHFVMRLALVESGALLGMVAYLVEGERAGLGVGLACIAVMAALLFPTRERVERLLAARQ